MTDTFQWERCTVDGASGCVDIGGATSSQYTSSGDIGAWVRARGYRDGILIGESDPLGPIGSTPVLPDVWWAGPTPTLADLGALRAPTREITTAAQLLALLKSGGTIAGGDVALVRASASGNGALTIAARPGSFADVIFEDGWTWVGPAGSASAAVPFSGTKLRLWGGDLSNPDGGASGSGGDCLKIAGSSAGAIDFSWKGLKIHDVAAIGVSAQCNGQTITADIESEVSNWGMHWQTLDPHLYEKGTGLHAFYLGGSPSGRFTGRVVGYAHDSGVGAAWSCGAHMRDVEVWLSGRNLPRVTSDRFSGVGFQQWGGDNTNVVVKNLLVDGATLATFFESLSSGPVTVEYGRYKNILLTPKYQTNPHVTYGDWAAG